MLANRDGPKTWRYLMLGLALLLGVWLMVTAILIYSAAGSARVEAASPAGRSGLITATPTPTPSTCVGNYATATATIAPGIYSVALHCSNCSTIISLPFPFTIYGQTYTQANVTVDGTLQFVTNYHFGNNGCLPASGYGPTLFAYWDDLWTIVGNDDVLVSTSGSVPDLIFNIEWRAHYVNDVGNGAANFEIRLYQGIPDRFDFVYGRVDQQGYEATVGVQDAAGRFIQYECNTGGVYEGLRISFGGPCGTPTPTATGTPPTATITRTPTSLPGPTHDPPRYAIQGALVSDNNPRFTPVVSLYVAGGLTASNTPISRVGRYNPITNNWSTVPPLPVPLGRVALGGSSYYLYAAGGYLGGSGPGSVANTVYIYNAMSNIWSVGAATPSHVEAAAGAVWGGRFYVMGGDDSAAILNTNYIYDIGSNTWSQGAPLPAPRKNAYAIVQNGLIYLFGGLDAANQAVDALFAYNPSANSWTTLSSANTGGLGNYGGISQLGANRLIAVDGGTANFEPSATTHIYDIPSDSWSQGPTMRIPRMGMAQGTLLDGRVLVFGGLDSNNPPEVTNTSEIIAMSGPNTPTFTRTMSPTLTATPTGTITLPTFTYTPMRTFTPASTPTTTPFRSPTLTYTSTITMTPSRPPTSPEGTPTPTASSTYTPITTFTRTPVLTGTNTPTRTASPLCTVIPTFTDVEPGDWFYEYLLCLYCHGSISGYSDGTFRPNANTTRGQLSKITVLAFDWAVSCPASGHFSDVPTGSAFYCFIETAYAHNIVSGYTDGTFRPGNNVTRGQLSKIIVSAAGWPTVDPRTPTFSDVSRDSPFYVFIETTVCRHIIAGYSDGAFRPSNNATRAQIVKIVCLAVRSEHDCTPIIRRR